MADNIGTVTIKLQADTGEYILQINKAEKETEKTFGQKLGSGLKTGGKLLGAAVGSAVTASFSAAIGVATSNMDGAISRMDALNNFPKVMSNLNISQEESQAAIDKMSDKLTGLPTTLDDAALAVQRFTSKNQDVAESTDMFLALNNALLAGGASTDIQASALEQMSQAYAKGKPDMLEWRTLMTAMPAQLTQVAQAMGGISADELGQGLRDGTISMDDFMHKLMEMNETGVDGFQSLEEQARNSTSGLGTQLQTLKTSVVKVMADAFNGKDMTKSFDQLVQRATDVIPRVVKGIASGAGQLMQMIPTIFDSILQAIAELWPQLIQQLIDLTLQITQNLPQFLQIIMTMILQLSQAIVQQLPTILRAIVQAVMGIATMLVSPENMTLLLDTSIQLFYALVDALPTIIDAFAEALPALIDSIVTFLTDPETIGKIIAAGLTLFFGLVAAVPKILGSLITTFTSLFKSLWDSVGKLFQSFSGKFGAAISNAFIDALNSLIGFIEGAINSPINAINGAIDLINMIPGVNIGHMQTVHFDRIPKVAMATGGLVNGPTTALIGEAGKEAVIPLEENTDWAKIMAKELDKQFTEDGGGRIVNVYMTNQINNKLDINEVATELTTLIRRTI